VLSIHLITQRWFWGLYRISHLLHLACWMYGFWTNLVFNHVCFETADVQTYDVQTYDVQTYE